MPYTCLVILTLEGQPPPRHLSIESVGRWHDGGCPSKVKMPKLACIAALPDPRSEIMELAC